jgi:hypothetical protein
MRYTRLSMPHFGAMYHRKCLDRREQNALIHNRLLTRKMAATCFAQSLPQELWKTPKKSRTGEQRNTLTAEQFPRMVFPAS